MPKIAKMAGPFTAVAISTEAYAALKEIVIAINSQNVRTVDGYPAKVNIGNMATFAVEQFVKRHKNGKDS